MIRGSIVALITPFHQDGSVNYSKIEELIEWHIEEGTGGVLVLGTTGETPSLTEDEKDQIAMTAIRASDGRIPIIVGSGSNNTYEARNQSLKYQEMGADAVLVITPYYNKTNKRGMLEHFYAVANAISIPMILYNVPGRTGCTLTYEAVRELSRHENIVGIKEASGDITLVSKIAKLASDDFAIYSGNDDMIVPLMSLGGAGVISVLANILPRETSLMTKAFLEGDIERAKQLQLHYLDFIFALFSETNPIPIKEAMNLIGLDVGGYRLPLYAMEDSTRAMLADTMRQVGFAV
ncbi:MAG: 4-hydroxy-tetrahydrodipicolinate synthase [Clostridiales bacterium]|nr:4-hydroxy-tetrahydrodipicolinate synthase [Clostridiales bacterium]